MQIDTKTIVIKCSICGKKLEMDIKITPRRTYINVSPCECNIYQETQIAFEKGKKYTNKRQSLKKRYFIQS